VEKIKKQISKSKGGKPSKKDGSGPIMFLVGEVGKLTERRGDPQEAERALRVIFGME